MQIKLTYYKPQYLIPVLGLLWAGSLWLLQWGWQNNLLRGFGPTAIVMFFLVLYDKWLWKFPLFNQMISVPDLNGTFDGKITFRRNGQEECKTCKLAIKQTCSNIKIKSRFSRDGENDTESVSTEAFVKTDGAGDQHLYFYYQNRGSCMDGDTLDQHDGMNVLEINNDGENIHLNGYYFTNRNPQTKGCIEVTKINERANS